MINQAAILSDMAYSALTAVGAECRMGSSN